MLYIYSRIKNLAVGGGGNKHAHATRRNFAGVAITLLAACALFAGHARADAAIAPCAIQLHIAAYHAEPGYNGNTPGVGLLCPVSDDWRLAAGTYNNSLRKQSVYAGAAWQPVRLGPVKTGVFAGMVSGYQDDAVPFAALALSVPIGPVEAHLMVIPKVQNVSPATMALSVSFGF
jgi:hypothetical protein